MGQRHDGPDQDAQWNREGARTIQDIRFDTPLYSLNEAARMLDVPTRTFRDWAKGYTRRRPEQTAVSGEPVITALPAGSSALTVPFVGLAEGMVLAAVRRAGVPLQRIRPALDALARSIGIEHALASKALYTDGAEVLYDYAEGAGDDQADAARELVVVRHGQRVFADVVEDYLRRIEYAPDGYARLLRLPRYAGAEVVADPERSWGQPIFARGGARVSDVLQRFWAGEDLDSLVAEFGVPVSEIEDVLRVASRWAA